MNEFVTVKQNGLTVYCQSTQGQMPLLIYIYIVNTLLMTVTYHIYERVKAVYDERMSHILLERENISDLSLSSTTYSIHQM